MPVKGDLYCKTHDTRLKPTQAKQHHRNGCEVWYFDPETGEPSHPYGKKAEKAAGAAKTSIKTLDQSGADIEEHVKGFKEPDPEILFIYYPGGKIQRLWDRFGDHQSIYRALVSGGFFKGTPAEFVDASARYMLAAAGYESEPCIIPASMRPAYDETARLIRDGMLKIYYDEAGKMRLEVNQEEGNGRHKVTQGGVPQGGDQHQPERLSSQGGEKEPGQAE